MAKTVITAIEVNPETLFDADGDVRQWMRNLTRELKAAVVLKAPPNRSRAKWPGRRTTRALIASIYGTTGRSGPVQDVSEVGVRAPHAVYVLGGTAYQGMRFIYRSGVSKSEADRLYRLERRGVHIDPAEMRGKTMRLPPYGRFGTYHLKVKGQRANNFLFDGYNEMSLAHEALGQFRNPYAF